MTHAGNVSVYLGGVQTNMRSGVRVAVDVGAVRVGIAACDAAGMLASPLAVVSRDARGGQDIDAIASVVAERAAIEVVVGLPRTLRDAEGTSANNARKFAMALATRVRPVAVRLVDERLSTVTASHAMQAAGRSTRQQRGRIDAAAAAVILQSALDVERNTGNPPGEVVTADAD